MESENLQNLDANRGHEPEVLECAGQSAAATALLAPASATTGKAKAVSLPLWRDCHRSPNLATLQHGGKELFGALMVAACQPGRFEESWPLFAYEDSCFESTTSAKQAGPGCS